MEKVREGQCGIRMVEGINKRCDLIVLVVILELVINKKLLGAFQVDHDGIFPFANSRILGIRSSVVVLDIALNIDQFFSCCSVTLFLCLIGLVTTVNGKSRRSKRS